MGTMHDIVRQRPRCLQCADRLRPQFGFEALSNPPRGGGYDYDATHRPVMLAGYGRGGRGLFCSSTCAVDWANAAAKHLAKIPSKALADSEVAVRLRRHERALRAYRARADGLARERLVANAVQEQNELRAAAAARAALPKGNQAKLP